MTVKEAIDKVDALQPNMFTKADKVGWLSHLDMRVQHQILDTHEYNDGETEIHFTGYTTDGSDDTEMLAPVPYDEMYVHWLEAQINYYNMEYDGFNAANMLSVCSRRASLLSPLSASERRTSPSSLKRMTLTYLSLNLNWLISPPSASRPSGNGRPKSTPRKCNAP